MTRAEAAQMLIGKMSSVEGMHHSMPMSQVKDKVIGALTDLAVDLILENDKLQNQLALAMAFPENRAV